MRAVEFLGCLLRLPPDQAEPGRPPEDRLHHTIRSLLLPDHDIRLEKCRCHFSALHAEMSLETTRQKCPRLRRRHCGEDREARYLAGRPEETFANLRRFQIKLNPEKCVFGVPAGQLLGFLVSERGIECNPVKIKAIERMEIPTKLRDVQKSPGAWPP